MWSALGGMLMRSSFGPFASRCSSRFGMPRRGLDEWLEPFGKADKDGLSPRMPKIGRAWKVDELRLKSEEDLHKLWFVMVKEKNLINSQRAQIAVERDHRGKKLWNYYGTRLRKVAQGMARLQTVLGERARQQQAVSRALHQDKVWMGHQRRQVLAQQGNTTKHVKTSSSS